MKNSQMTIKNARMVTLIILVPALISAVLACIFLKMIFVYVAAGFVVLAGIFTLIFMRCPNCGHYLKFNKSKGKTCPYCGCVLHDNM